MGVRVEEQNGVVILRVSGDLREASEVRALKSEVDRLVDEGARRLLVDLSEVGIVSSRGIGTMVACLTSVRRTGGDLKLLGAPQRVLVVLKVCRVLDVCEHFPDSEAAVHSFGPFSV